MDEVSYFLSQIHICHIISNELWYFDWILFQLSIKFKNSLLWFVLFIPMLLAKDFFDLKNSRISLNLKSYFPIVDQFDMNIYLISSFWPSLVIEKLCSCYFAHTFASRKRVINLCGKTFVWSKTISSTFLHFIFSLKSSCLILTQLLNNVQFFILIVLTNFDNIFNTP